MPAEEEPQKKTDLRQVPRRQFREPVQLYTKARRQAGYCLGYDISKKGLRITVEDFIPLNSEVMVKLTLPNGKTAELLGLVIWVNQLPHSERYQVGLKFTDDELSATARQEFQQYFKPH